MTSISSLLSELDWSTSVQQEAVLQIMHFYGCFEQDLPTHLLAVQQVEELRQKESSFNEINLLMQDKLKRPLGSERGMLEADYRLVASPELSQELLSRYEQLGMIKSIIPPLNQSYDAILLLGASQSSFTERLQILVKFFEESAGTGTIYVLSSIRKLWPLDEPMLTSMLAECVNDSIEEIHANFAQQFPKEIRNQPQKLNQKRDEVFSFFANKSINFPTESDMTAVLFDNSAIRDIAHYKLTSPELRATTEDTIRLFDQTFRQQHDDLVGAKILVVSKQPEALYQIEPVKKVLHAEAISRGDITYGKIDLLAAEVNNPNPIVINDAIARRVYSRLEQKQILRRAP